MSSILRFNHSNHMHGEWFGYPIVFHSKRHISFRRIDFQLNCYSCMRFLFIFLFPHKHNNNNNKNQRNPQNLKGTRYRLKIVVSELDAPNTPLEYQVALLAFVNCLINATQNLRDRIRIRNEFIGECCLLFFHVIHNALSSREH